MSRFDLTREEQQTIADALVDMAVANLDEVAKYLGYYSSDKSRTITYRLMAKEKLMRANAAHAPLYLFDATRSRMVEEQIIALEAQLNEKTATDKVTA